MAARGISALAGGRAVFSLVLLLFVRVYILLRKARLRLPEESIRFSLPSPRPDGVYHHRWACGDVSPADMSLVDFLGSGHSSSTFMCFQVGSF